MCVCVLCLDSGTCNVSSWHDGIVGHQTSTRRKAVSRLFWKCERLKFKSRVIFTSILLCASGGHGCLRMTFALEICGGGGLQQRAIFNDLFGYSFSYDFPTLPLKWSNIGCCYPTTLTLHHLKSAVPSRGLCIRCFAMQNRWNVSTLVCVCVVSFLLRP